MRRGLTGFDGRNDPWYKDCLSVLMRLEGGLFHGPAWEREVRMARLLIAEDDHLMRWSLETSLGRDGHAVHSVDSGEAAIDAAMNGGYQVIITDYALPGPDGLDVLWHIKTRIPQTHVIVITGQATQELEKLARDMGAFDFLEKPFPFAALKGSVERAIATPERRKGPRGCCGECVWQNPCARWATQEPARVANGPSVRLLKSTRRRETERQFGADASR